MLTLAVWLAAAAVAAPLPPAVPVKDLQGLDLDAWTAGFWRDAPPAALPLEAAQERLVAEGRAAPSAAAFYARLAALGLNRRYASREEHETLTRALLGARRELRPLQRVPGEAPRPGPEAYRLLHLLGLLAEETLYAAEVRFSSTTADWVVSYESPGTADCSVDGRSPRLAAFRGLTVCSGDVLVSKEDSLFSSFSARRLKRPMQFSHSSLAFVPPGPRGELRLLESNGKDEGLKLRDATGAYKDTLRLYAYRLRHPDPATRRAWRRAAMIGADRLVAEMRRRSGGKPETEASFLFDYYNDPEDLEELYCSEVPYDAYRRGGLADGRNPYPRSLWSELDPLGAAPDGTQNFWRDGLGARALIAHDAGDVELNPNFEVAGLILVPGRLRRERVDAAITDAAYAYLSSDAKGARTRYRELSSRLGMVGVTAEDLARLRESRLLPDTQIAALAAKVLGRRERFSLRTVLLFVTVDGMLGGASRDSMRSRLLAADADSVAKTGKPLGLNALRTLASRIAFEEADGFYARWDARRGR